MEITLPSPLSKANKSDWKRIRDITAEAFSEDPFNLWIFGNPRPLKSLFGIFAHDVYLKNGFCHYADDAAATMWAMSDANIELPSTSLWKLIISQTLFASSGAAKRGLAAGAAMAKAHPETPHIYLFTVGTRKSARGKGLGKAMLSPVLAQADRISMPVYLENSNPNNHGFYSSLGFEKTGELEIGPGAPPVATMWREPTQA